MEDLTGMQFGPYRITAPLGEGGMAAVYRAFHAATDRYVALKVLPRHYANEPEFVGRFRQEARILAKLQHPHILPVFDFGEQDGYTYLVMPFIEGGTLAQLLTGKPLPLSQVRRIISQVGGALDFAHSHGLIHRDVKPSNILIDQSGNCLLSDFGIAKIVENTQKFTTTGGILGTPAYMAPEQGLGRAPDARADIYALGVVTFEMVTGRPPYVADTPMAVLIKHIHDPLPLPRSLNPKLPEQVENVILKALSKEPQDRYPSAGAMVQGMQSAIPENGEVSDIARGRLSRQNAERVGEPTSAQPATESPARDLLPQPTIRSTRWPTKLKSRIWVMAIGGMLVLALATCVLMGTFISRNFGARLAPTLTTVGNLSPSTSTVSPNSATSVVLPAASASITPQPTSITYEPTALASTATPSMQTATVAASGGLTTGSEIDCKGAKPGDTISIIYRWSGNAEAQFSQVLQPLVLACGISIKTQSTQDPAVPGALLQAGTPPDIIVWDLNLLNQYRTRLKTLGDLGASRNDFDGFLLAPGIIDNDWLAMPVRVNVKSIIWYNPAVFRAKGYTVPATWNELNALVETMVSKGDTPWSMGFEAGAASGWTGSDFIQDILLVQQGPDYVNAIISGRVPYNDPAVKQAYETYGKWAQNPKYTSGGAQGTISTSFVRAIYEPFLRPPQAMMVKQADLAGGLIAMEFPGLKYGTDYDFFTMPGTKGLQGGADWMMAVNGSNAVKAFVTYLASPLGGANWAKANLGLSPNIGAHGMYLDPALQKLDAALFNIKGFTLDLGDTIGGSFANTEWSGIINYLEGQDLDTQLLRDAQAQAAALKK